MSEELIIDAEHPWPWLDAYPEKAEQFFNGRDQDSEALLRHVIAAPVTILFGKSGLGKSSLLQAGLFPRLRNERMLPVYIRLNHGPQAPNASEQILKIFHAQLKEFLPSVYAKITQSHTETLWIQLHRTAWELRDSEDRRWMPVFVLDQFEEVFTLEAQQPERQKQLFCELGDLMENRISKMVAERLQQDDTLYDTLNLDTQSYRFVLSLREDYLPDLDPWSNLIPRLAPNRYRLLPMNKSQAEQAIIITGSTLVTPGNAKAIVDYLTTQSASDTALHRHRAHENIEPALLSLICSGLNDNRIQTGSTALDTTKLNSEGSLIIEKFYDAAFKGLPESLHDLVEQQLITSDGVRLQYPVRSIETGQLATQEQIRALSNRRLIRRENLEDGDRIELVHDRLAQVALQRKLFNQQRKENLRKRKIFGTIMIAAVTIIFGLIGFTGFIINANQAALQAEKEALEAKTKAEHALLDATALRLAAEGSAMTAGLRPGGTLQGLFKVLAGHRISPSASTDETLQLEYLKHHRLIQLVGINFFVSSLAFSPDGKRIVSGSDDNTLRLWDANSGKLIGLPFTGHENSVLSVAFSPDGKRIASGSDDNTLRLWDANSGKPIGLPFTGHENSVLSVAFSPDGKRIVSGSSDKTLRLWDADSGNPIGQPFTGHENSVSSVAFSSDGKRIVSGSWDKTLRLWDANSGKPIGLPFTDHENSISSVAFSPDGKRIVSGSFDKSPRLWQVFEGWADALCQKLARNMTQAEWSEWVSPDIAYRKMCPTFPIPADERASNE